MEDWQIFNKTSIPAVAYPEVNLGTLQARAWENQLGVCKLPSGYRAEPCWWTGGEAPGKF